MAATSSSLLTLISGGASIATMLGVAAIPVAIYTFRSQARAVRLSHMHKLFTDYLRMAFDLSLAEPNNDSAEAQLASFRMYTMEEMLLWIDAERRTLDARFSARYRTALNNWEDTIVSHLTDRFEETSTDCSRETFLNMKRYRNCYTKRFQSFVDTLPEIMREKARYEASLPAGEPAGPAP